MTTEYLGKGDPRRSLALLWGEEAGPRRGPKPGLDVARIVGAAIELADAEGLTALSIRRVAERLGVGAMSLYTYIPGKAELLDLIHDRVLGELLAEPLPEGDWRVLLEARARQDWALYERHPWLLGIASARAVLGPNETALLERTLASAATTGLRGRALVATVTLVGGYVRGAAQGALDAAAAARQTGTTDDEWWAARESILDRYFEPARYPTLIAVEQAGGFAPPAEGDYHHGRALDDFAFGLARVLDGIAAHIAAHAG
jgi:AcrR family transcriptional regulator